MALSQIQCLDDNHVNPRTHESKPEFLYCEDQRLALEALLRDGREAFFKYLQYRGLRGFLSDPELDALVRELEPYDPGLELFPENAGDDDPPLSLHYWPDLSDTSIPQMDLGWPDCDAYRGVTRTTVYTQPPLDGQAHIKEVVRKMIAQAQKVIAVVMDVFTDVDIFRDLLDAGFRRRVSVYILLERTTLPHFLSMCQRANMHPGHLKHLRVRCSEGAGFFTRSCSRVKGKLGHRFMFIDGDKAMSGSYSFTWMSSRLDRNLITVITGQAVEAFDRLFRFLFANSSSVELRQVATEPEPEQEPLPQPVAPAPPSAALARKLYSPKYALVVSGNRSSITSSHQNSLKDSVNTKDPNTKRRRKRREDNIQEAPPLHPGLVGLEKASLITYLPTWPEPDPPSDVIGFINIRDASRPTQVHLQRSEMFETSQAIRFSSPFSMPKEALPEVAQPRQLTAKQEVNKPQTTQSRKQAEESVVDKVQSTQLSEDPLDIKSPASGKKSKPDKDATEALDTETKLLSDTPTNQDADHNTTPHLSATTPCLSTNGTSNDTSPSPTTQTVPTSSPKPQYPPGSHTTKETGTSVNAQYDDEYRTLQLSILTDLNSNSEQRTKTKTELSHTDSNTQGVYIQPQSSSEMTPSDHSHTSTSSVSSTSLSEKKHIPVPAEDSRTADISTSKPLPCISSSLTSTPPIPKPRTVQLVFKDDSTSNGLTLPKISVVRSPERQASPEPPVVHSKPDVANLVHTPQEKDLEMVPQAQNGSGNKREAEKHSENTENPEEASQETQNVTSHEIKHEETVGLQDDGAEVQSASATKPQARSDLLISDAAKADSVNIQEIILKEVEPKSLTSTDCKITPKTETDSEATARKDTEAPEKTFTSCEFSEVPNEKSENAIQCKTNHTRANEPQRILYCEENPADSDVLETVDSLKAPTHSPASAINNTHRINSEPNMTKQNTHVDVTSQDSQQTPKPRESTHTPERPLRLHVYDTHVPDLRSATQARELRPVSAPARTSTPDGFHSCTPTPDSQTHTPDPQSVSPDIRMLTPTSDGYISSREDSTPSTTSEEFYECSDTPFHDPAFRNHGTPVDNENMTLTNTPNAATSTTTTTRPACISNTTSDETQSSSGPSPFSTSSSSPEKVETGEETEDTNEENGREENDKGKKLSLAEKKTERNSKVVKKRGGPSGVERRDRPQSTKDINRQKTGASSPSQPSRPLSATQPVGAQAQENHQPNQAESKAPQESSQVLINASPPREAPSRPPPPAPGRKQGEVSQQVESKSQTGQSQNIHPSQKPRASSLSTLSNSDSQNQAVEQEEGKAPFNFTFGRLYTLKDLKDKMSKLPARSKKSKTSSPGQGRKSTS